MKGDSSVEHHGRKVDCALDKKREIGMSKIGQCNKSVDNWIESSEECKHPEAHSEVAALF